MKQPALLLCLPSILLYVHAAVAAPSAPPSGSVSEMQRKQPRSVLAGDARLRVPLTAKYIDRPLGEILAAVGRELKLPLRADRTVVDDRATLCVRGRPAAECLDALAQQFGFQWRRKNGYELWQSSASLRGEALLREQDLAAQVKALEAQMQRVAELKIDEANAAAHARELERNLFSDAASLPMAEQKRRTAEWSRMQREAAAPLAIAVYQSLTPSQARRLVEAGELFLTSTDGTLSAALSERVNSLAASLFSSPVFDPLQAHVDIRLDEGVLEVAKPPANPTPHLSLRFTLTSLRRLDKVPEGQVDTRPAFGPKRPPAQAVTQNWWPELPPETADPVEAPTDDPLLRQEVDLQFPRAAQRRLSTTANPDSPRGALTSGSAWPTDWVTLGEIAEALHTTTGLNVIADSFVRTRLDPARLSGKRSVAQVLALLAREWRYSWRREDNLVFLRSRVAHWDRVQAVPERILVPWQARVTGKKVRPGVADLDDLAQLASALTDRQCWGMQGYWGWYLWQNRQRIPPPNPGGFPTPPGGFYSFRQHFRLWASLSPAQRQRALSTAGLPVSELSRLQAAQFVRAFSSVQYEAYLPADRRRTPTGEDLATGVFRVAAGSFYEQEYAGSRSGREEIFRSSHFPDRKHPKGIERHEFDDPEGFAEITWRPIGAVLAVGEYRFQYHLAGEEKPSRTAAVETVAPGEPT